FGLSRWFAHQLDRAEADQLAMAALQQHHISPPDHKEAEAWFSQNGSAVTAPRKFDDRFLFSYSFSDFPGFKKPQRVPCLLYVRIEDQGRQSQIAWVYILSKKQLNLDQLPEKFPSLSGSNFKCEVWHPERSPEFAYVIVYSGDRLEDLL